MSSGATPKNSSTPKPPRRLRRQATAAHDAEQSSDDDALATTVAPDHAGPPHHNLNAPAEDSPVFARLVAQLSSLNTDAPNFVPPSQSPNSPENQQQLQRTQTTLQQAPPTETLNNSNIMANQSETNQTGGTGITQTSDTTPLVAATAPCKPSPYWTHSPRLWFDHVDTLFQLHRLVSDNSKYLTVVSTLDPDTLNTLIDIVRAPPEGSKYETIKDALFSRLADSPEKQLNTLLHEIQLGDQKPSQLFRRMKDLAGGKVQEEVLRIRWMSLLPLHVQNVLKISKVPQPPAPYAPCTLH